MKIIGIDDAGRGPILGPMILTGILIEKSEEEFIKQIGAKDSKLLTSKKRKKISDVLKEKYFYHYELSSPEEIDNFPNLNNLEAVKSGIIINFLMKDIEEKVIVYVDCPSVNTKSWGDLLFSMIIKKEQVELICEHKADFNYPVVSAASIISKEIREDEIKKLKKDFDVDFGSGYPADPKTKNFLVKTFGERKYDSLIRKSWSTYRNLIAKMDQKKLFYL